MRRPAPAAEAVSENLTMLPHRDLARKPSFGTVWDMAGQKIQRLGLKLKAFITFVRDLHLHLCQTNHESAWLGYLKCLRFPRT